jgi:hypothetical protein
MRTSFQTQSRVKRLMVALATSALVGGLVAATPVPAQAETTPAAPLPAAPSDVTHGQTTTQLTITKAMVTKLNKAGIKIKAVGPTTASSNKGSKVLAFPTTGTDPDTREFLHDGGIAFTRKKTTLKLTKLRLGLNDQTLRATISGEGKAEVLRAKPGKQSTDTVQLTLNKLFASILNHGFHTHQFKAGQAFGAIQLPERLGSGSTVAETIQITNNSRYTLNFVSIDTNGMGTVTSTPLSVLRPGEFDTITYESNNSHGGEVKPTYRIDGSEHTFYGFFQVPMVSGNTAACPQDAWVGYDNCKIESGWKPSASWVINTNTATGPIIDLGSSPSGHWEFHLIGAPGNRQVQVMGDSTDNGAAVNMWDAFNQGNYQWRWVPTTDGWGQLRNITSGRCLEVNGTDGSVDQWDCTDNADNQLWKTVLNPSGGSALQVKSTNKYLTSSAAPGSVVNGTTLVMDSDLSTRNSWGADS